MCYKYKFLHICPPSTRMVKSFFLMLKDNFNLTEHYFLSRVQSSGCDGFTAISPNIINYNDLGIGKVRKFFALRDILSKSKNIIIHGFTFNIPWLIFLYFHKRFLEKAVWVIWGIDLYNFKRVSGNPIKNAILNHMETKCRAACKTCVVIFPSDEDVFKGAFGKDKNLFCIPLPMNNVNFMEWDIGIENIASLKQGPHTTEIMVGHNAFPFNKHGEVILMLERFKDKDIRINLPMSYGNDGINAKPNYKNDLLALLKNLSLDKKSRILNTLLPKTQYHQFLSNMDIAIFAAERQNGLANILALLYMGKKIYISKNNPVYKVLNKVCGIEIHDIKEIEKLSFEEFISPIQAIYPHPWIKHFFSIETSAPRWQILFDFNDGKLSFADAKKKLDSLMKEQEENMLALVDMMGKFMQTKTMLQNNSYKDVCKFMRIAAKGGNLDAIYEASNYLIEEDKPTTFSAKGLEYLKKVAKYGHVEAIYALARVYELGLHGEEKNISKAVKLYTKAASMGHATAIGRVGTYTFNGENGFAKDEVRGIAMLKEAAHHGILESILALGHIYYTGDNIIERDITLALDFYSVAAKMGNITAMFVLGRHFCLANTENTNFAKGLSYLKQAANAGYVDAWLTLATIYETGASGVDANKEMAIKSYEKAAELGSLDAMRVIGMYLCNCRQDDIYEVRRGFSYIVRAAEGGNVRAIVNLARSYENGFCVERNLDKALEYYERAASLGDKSARKRAFVIRSYKNKKQIGKYQI